MLEVNRLVKPSPEQFDIVVRGMRNAFKSYVKADSDICDDYDYKETCPFEGFWDVKQVKDALNV